MNYWLEVFLLSLRVWLQFFGVILRREQVHLKRDYKNKVFYDIFVTKIDRFSDKIVSIPIQPPSNQKPPPHKLSPSSQFFQLKSP